MADLNDPHKRDIIKKLKNQNEKLFCEKNILQIQNKINKLIIRQNNVKKLMEKACALLTSNRFFKASFALLYDEDKDFQIINYYKKDEIFPELEKYLKKNQFPNYLSEELGSQEIQIIKKNSEFRRNSYLLRFKQNQIVSITPITYGDEYFGFLITYLRNNIFIYEKVLERLEEISTELGYGIYNIEREKVEERVKNALQRSEKRYRLLSNNARDLIYAHDLEGNILFVNKAVQKFLDMDKEQIIGKNVYEFAPRQEKERLNRRNRIRTSGNQNHHIYEMLVKLPNGKKVPLEVNSVPIIEDGEIIGIHCVARDITERKRTESALRQSKQKYQKAFNRAEFYKDLFAHDIRNILQGILTGLQLIEIQLLRSENRETSLENIDIVRSQIERGQRLVLNIKKLSQITHDERNLNPVKIFPILEGSIRNIKNVFNDRSIAINIHCQNKDLKIKANELLEDLFENLLLNSIKHNDNKNIEITVNIIKNYHDNTEFVKFEFLDNGIGIKDSRKEEIFERADYDIQKLKGLGLGLSLVKRIVNLYNGKIWIENRIKDDHSKGSKFIIEILEFK